MAERYLGGNSDEYSSDNPGSDFITCLSDESHICLVKSDFLVNTGDVNLNSADEYTIGNSTPIPQLPFTLTMEGNFTFTILSGKEYNFENLQVCM
jgi:hypothetical protein